MLRSLLSCLEMLEAGYAVGEALTTYALLAGAYGCTALADAVQALARGGSDIALVRELALEAQRADERSLAALLDAEVGS